jgi:hypothetical protein
MQKLFSLPLASRLTGIPYQTVDDWIRRGILRLAKAGGRGTGHARALDVAGAIAGSVMWSLRQRGASFESLTSLATFLRGLTEDDLLRAFTEGKTRLVAAADQLPPQLVAADFQFQRMDPSVLWFDVDLEAAYHRLLAAASGNGAAVTLSQPKTPAGRKAVAHVS